MSGRFPAVRHTVGGILPVSPGSSMQLFAPGHKSLLWAQGTGVLVCGHALRPLAGGTGAFPKRVHAGIYARCGRSRDTMCLASARCARACGRNVGLDAICAHGKMLGQLLTAELEPSGRARTMEEIRRAWCRFYWKPRTWSKLRQGFHRRASRFGRGLHCAPLCARVCRDDFFRHSSRKLLFSTPRAHWRRR